MPLPLLAIAAAAPAIASLAGTAAKTVPGPLDKRNRERRQELESLVASGKGLTGEERGELERTLGGARKRATDMQSQNARLLASSGGTSAADVSQLRRDTAEALGRADLGIRDAIAGREIEAKQQNRAELAQLDAARQQRRNDIIEGMLGAAAQGANVLGQAGGAPPGTFTAADFGGAAVTDFKKFQKTLSGMGLSPEEVTELQQIEQRRPGAVSALVRQAHQRAEGKTSAEVRATIASALRDAVGTERTLQAGAGAVQAPALDLAQSLAGQTLGAVGGGLPGAIASRYAGML